MAASGIAYILRSMAAHRGVGVRVGCTWKGSQTGRETLSRMLLKSHALLTQGKKTILSSFNFTYRVC